jgi:diguanylate cyclase (GGDEF)-like protein
MLVAGGGSCSLGADGASGAAAELPLGLGALREAGARTAIVTPLLARGRTLGLLVLADERALAASTERAELVELVAAQAAANLRTAAAVADLRHRASTDPLTGLGHRGAFSEALGASHRRPIATAVALCDLDRFKELNDRLGHQAGDRALVAAVRALEGALRRGDLLFRLGGDEFAALLAVRDEREAHAAARRMRAAVAASDAGLTVSIGVAVSGPEEGDESLVGRADRALYAAKRDGRDGVALDPAPPVAGAATPI